MVETYECLIEILPKYQNTLVNISTIPNPTTSSIIFYSPTPHPDGLYCHEVPPPTKK